MAYILHVQCFAPQSISCWSIVALFQSRQLNHSVESSVIQTVKMVQLHWNLSVSYNQVIMIYLIFLSFGIPSVIDELLLCWYWHHQVHCNGQVLCLWATKILKVMWMYWLFRDLCLIFENELSKIFIPPFHYSSGPFHCLHPHFCTEGAAILQEEIQSPVQKPFQQRGSTRLCSQYKERWRSETCNKLKASKTNM